MELTYFSSKCLEERMTTTNCEESRRYEIYFIKSLVTTKHGTTIAIVFIAGVLAFLLAITGTVLQYRRLKRDSMNLDY
jgi:hypothetical protein